MFEISDCDCLLKGDLDAAVFAVLFGTTRNDIQNRCGSLIDNFDFRYTVIQDQERDAIILDVLNSIDSGNFKASGKNRKNDWESGWQENLEAFISSDYDVSTLAPKYISKHGVSRLFSNYIRPYDRLFELNFYTVYRHFLFSSYLGNYKNILEFGCGTGYNLVIMNRLFPEKKITGLDWAESSVNIADALGKQLNIPVSGRRFDYFAPDYNLDIREDSVVITLNSLEQIGSDYHAFLDFLLAKKPALCINAEPFLEMYTEGNLLDCLAIRYHKSRNYLNSYYTTLKQLEADGRIKLEKEQRVPFGNYFHEGYSYMIWKILS